MMKQTPRYDPANVDPLSIKPALAKLYNNTITKQWMDSQFKDRITIGNHRVTKTGKYDGIHLYGNSGRKAYTNSVINILKFAQLTSPAYDDHQTCLHYMYQQQHKYRKQTQTRRRGNINTGRFRQNYVSLTD